MAQNAMHANDSEILHSHPDMKFTIGHYRYEIKTDAKHTIYTVTAGDPRQRPRCSGRLASAARLNRIYSRKTTESSTRRASHTLKR